MFAIRTSRPIKNSETAFLDNTTALLPQRPTEAFPRLCSGNRSTPLGLRGKTMNALKTNNLRGIRPWGFWGKRGRPQRPRDV